MPMLTHSGATAIDAAAVIGRLNVSLLQALMNFKQELIEQVKLDSIGQHRLLKETLIEELQPLEQGFIELRQSIKKTLIEQICYLTRMAQENAAGCSGAPMKRSA